MEKMKTVSCSFCGHEMDCPENMLGAEKHACSFCTEVMEEGMSDEQIKKASERERELSGYWKDVTEMTDVIFTSIHPKNSAPREVMAKSKNEIEEMAFKCGVLATLDFILRTAGPEAILGIRNSLRFKHFDISEERFQEAMEGFRKEGLELDMRKLKDFKGGLRTEEDVVRLFNEALFQGDWEKQLEWARKRGRTEDAELIERIMGEGVIRDK